MCGTTLADCKHWGPTCGKTGRRVCAECCRLCELHVSWSGIWKCRWIPPEQIREEAVRKSRESFDAELATISAAYHRQRREQAKKRAARAARSRSG